MTYKTIETPFGTAEYATDGKTYASLRYSEYKEGEGAKIGRCNPVAGFMTHYFGEHEQAQDPDGCQRKETDGRRWSISFSKKGPSRKLWDLTPAQFTAVHKTLRDYLLQLVTNKTRFHEGEQGDIAYQLNKLDNEREKLRAELDKTDAAIRVLLERRDEMEKEA